MAAAAGQGMKSSSDSDSTSTSDSYRNRKRRSYQSGASSRADEHTFHPHVYGTERERSHKSGQFTARLSQKIVKIVRIIMWNFLCSASTTNSN